MDGTPQDEPVFDRREALWSATLLALGGTFGALAMTGCRAPQNVRDFPKGSPTGYLIDTTLCTRCGDCQRVCRCDAVSGHPQDAAQCWIILDKCCACGRCYRVCEPEAIVACYGPDKKPARQIPEFKLGQPVPTHDHHRG
jgi:uncharacterized Fe-S center protein